METQLTCGDCSLIQDCSIRDMNQKACDRIEPWEVENTIVIAPCRSCQEAKTINEDGSHFCNYIQMNIDECYAVKDSGDKFQNQKEGNKDCYAFAHIDMSWDDFNVMLEQEEAV